MKAADIQVGEEYAVGRGSSGGYWSRARVLNVGVARRTRGTDRRASRERGDGVEVVYLDTKGDPVQVRESLRSSSPLVDRVEVLAPAHVRQPWAEYQRALRAARKAEREARERSARVEARNVETARAIAKVLDGRGIPRQFGSGLTDRDLGLAGYAYQKPSQWEASYEVRRGRISVDLVWLAAAIGVPGFEEHDDV